MSGLHLKRLAAPKTWPIERKATVFIARPKPGAHSKLLSIPLKVLLIEVLKIAATASECLAIIKKEGILIDGRKATSLKTSVGLMDVIEIPSKKLHYRMVMNKKQKLEIQLINGDETNLKLSRIKKKWMQKGNQFMVSTHDGRTLKADKAWKTGDTLVISIPGTIVKNVLALKPGNTILLIGGSHVGQICTITKIQRGNLDIKLGKDTFSTPKEFAFVVGESKSIIKTEK